MGDAALIGGVALASVIFDVVFVSCNFLRGATTASPPRRWVPATARGTEHAAGAGIAVTVGLTLVLMRGPIGFLGLDVLAASGPVAEEGRWVFLRSGSGRHRLFCSTMSRSVGSSDEEKPSRPDAPDIAQWPRDHPKPVVGPSS